MTTPRKSGEFERIARIFAPLAAGWPGAFDLTDDAALLRPRPGAELAVTTDTAVGGVHFVGDEPPSLIARKLLRVNLSDLAAMGARPLAYRSAEHTSELQSLMRISYAVFCLKKKKKLARQNEQTNTQKQ